MKVLIIGDNKELSKSITEYLGAERFICECAFTTEDAKEKLDSFSYDFILLDIMLPGREGWELLTNTSVAETWLPEPGQVDELAAT